MKDCIRFLLGMDCVTLSILHLIMLTSLHIKMYVHVHVIALHLIIIIIIILFFLFIASWKGLFVIGSLVLMSVWLVLEWITILY